MRRNRVELGGTISSDPVRKKTPAGSGVISFWLRVDADPATPGDRGCSVRVVGLGRGSSFETALAKGTDVIVEGALAERRREGASEPRYEVLARAIQVMYK